MTSKKIIKILKDKFPKKEIIGIRGLTKVGEHDFSFRYVFRSGDHLSISDLMTLTEQKEKTKKDSKKQKSTVK